MTLELRHLFKRYGRLVTIEDVTATFEPGLIYGLIGPNGAGKSTIINLIAGSYTLSEGEILLDGMRLDGLKKHKIAQAGIARTYQNVRLFDQMSVIDNLEVCFYPEDVGRVWRDVLWPPAARARSAFRREICQDLLETFDLAGVAELDAESLPYGRQRMLEIARALVREPRVLLLDEPAAGLNHDETGQLMDRLARLRSPDRIMIVVEHDMELVMSLCDRIVVLHHGQLLRAGTPQEVQSDEAVQQAYLGTADDLDTIKTLAQGRRASRRIRSERDPVWH